MNRVVIFLIIFRDSNHDNKSVTFLGEDKCN
jgi:hypothetical protein